MNKELQYQVFDWLRFPLIVGVVFIHCYGKPFDYDAIVFTHLTSMDFYNLFRVSISKVATHVCVPCYFFISGFLFFKGLDTMDKMVYLRKLKKRIKTLFVPFLIWNTVYVLICVLGKYRHGGMSSVYDFLLENGYWHLWWDSHVWNINRTNWLGGVIPSSSPMLVPLWYLRDLMIVMLFSPLLFYLFKYTKILGLLFLCVCNIIGVGINISGFSTSAFFFFGTGAFFYLNKIDVTDFSFKFRYVFYFITLLLWISCTFLNGHNTKTGDYIYPFYVIFGSISVFNIATTIVRNGKFAIPSILSRSSFFIYLVHTILITQICRKIVTNILCANDVISLTIGYILVPMITLSICLCGYCLLTEYFPRLSKILTGDR